MAPILEEMEQEIKGFTDVEVELPSYVDDIHAELCVWDEVQAKGIDMEYLLEVVDAIVNRVADTHRLLLEKSKHEKLG